MGYERLILSVTQVEKIVQNNYGIEGTASKLPGEIDINYKISTKNSKDYILKISRPNIGSQYLDFQIKIINFIKSKKNNLDIPDIVLNNKNDEITEFIDSNKQNRKARLLTWIPGRLWSSVNPQTDDLRFSLGEKSGIMTSLLDGFHHKYGNRKFEWDISQSLWTKKYLNIFKKEEKEIIKYFIKKFELNKGNYDKLRKSFIHNDINDNNIIVNKDLINPEVNSIIDYGDSIETHTINELGTVCAYCIMNQSDPLSASIPIVSGYHKNYNIKENEIEHLYNVIAMKLVISVTKSAINKNLEPDNEYLQISEKPAWSLLKKWINVDSEFACFSYRKACKLNAHKNKHKFENWANKNNFSITDLFPYIKKNRFFKIDLSVSSDWIGGRNEIEDLDVFQFKIERLQKKNQEKIIAGGYLEPRSIYSSNSYEKIGNNGDESRTIHLGLDFWLPSGTQVSAMFDGDVVTAINDSGNKEYGGLIILKHQVNDFIFYTLYGHNTVKSVLKYKVGDKIKKGDIIAEIANYPENGNWAPHLHFQIMLSMLNYEIDFPGVCYFSQMDVWRDLCPDPNLLFKSKDLENKNYESDKSLLKYRQKHLGKSLKLQYDQPIHIVRGEGVYLIDKYGKKYLDTVNNVAHVGHENTDVVNSGKSQMSILNTNSRYLHKKIDELTQELLKTLPKELSVVHYVNSGSEANELAIRMMKSNTGQNDIIVSEHGYHGNTNICVDISSYKFDGKGGSGAPKYTHVIPIPSRFNGKYNGVNMVDEYVGEIENCIKGIKSKERELGGFIIEPIISCGGQVELPDGFLKKAYEIVRKNGGVCISDEVQVGCGRMGKTFWGFQLHNVVPDIITIGKPFGNGHPIGAVVCTEEIAINFSNGMEFFNTFGGNPVSCSIANQVLKVVKSENLQKNANKVGGYFKKELKKLSKKFDIIGDVRGEGLFLGIEFIDYKMNPLTKESNYIINRLKNFGILSSVDGPNNNVIKIKPPLIFTKEHCNKFIFYLNKILEENFLNK